MNYVLVFRPEVLEVISGLSHIIAVVCQKA